VIPAPVLGWMAGVVDLRGRLIYKNNKQRATPQVVLMVETKEEPIVRELARWTGTTPEMRKAQPLKDFMRRACSEHCPEAHVHQIEFGDEDRQMPQIARWTITGAGMVVVMSSLIPYLMVDRGYVQGVEMARQATVLEGQGSGMVRNSLRRLQTIGWEIPEDYRKALWPGGDSEEQEA
jgi:hypothetical protein